MKFHSLLLLVLMIGCASPNANPPQPGAVTSGKVSWSATKKGELQYLQYVPKDYDADPERQWPILLFLHGAGERGTNVQRVAVHGPLKLVNEGRHFPFIIIAPQCPAGEYWQTEGVLKLLDDASERFRVDRSRVYLAGLSMGGYGTWKFLMAHPERLAAAVPICGGGERIDLLGLKTEEQRTALRNLPVRAYHGARDPVVPLAESERAVEFLKRYGCTNVTLTVYPEAEHDSWTQTFANPELYEWLLKQRR
ncbi:MAG TPA: dienelactone hydrolase family protein [Verrucomicrobiae bacterium]|nr:dienelactone hydrolase family protein [Verrucomicrobiae bacterium]